MDDAPDAVHGQRVQVGNVHVTVEWWEGIEDGAPVVGVDHYQWVSGRDARDFAAAIVAACNLIDTANGGASAAT